MSEITRQQFDDFVVAVQKEGPMWLVTWYRDEDGHSGWGENRELVYRWYGRKSEALDAMSNPPEVWYPLVLRQCRLNPSAKELRARIRTLRESVLEVAALLQRWEYIHHLPTAEEWGDSEEIPSMLQHAAEMAAKLHPELPSEWQRYQFGTANEEKA